MNGGRFRSGGVPGVLVLFALAVSLPACGQSASQKSSVRMSALVDSLQPAITLEWEAQTGASGHTVYRRVPGARHGVRRWPPWPVGRPVGPTTR